MNPNDTQNPVVDPNAPGAAVNVPQPTTDQPGDATPVVETPGEAPTETPAPTTPVTDPTAGGTGDTGTGGGMPPTPAA